MPRLALILLLWLWPLSLAAQAPATLLADRVTVPPGSDRLVAEGNVEVVFEGTRLSAARITYDRAADRLQITGPIFIRTQAGEVLTAERASLDPRLENGLLRGARLILDDRLQLAADRIDRVGGRYTQLSRSAATSCKVCDDGRPPLWDIRAARVIHDQQARRLYFENARFRVRGVPILWLPRLRLPEPGVSRATGLLIPQLRTTDQLGPGLKLPYFIRLGDHRDLTVTPYLTPESATLEARYRQAYLRGEIEVSGAMTRDSLVGGTRGYFFADGAFHLAGGTRLRFDVETASDDAYLLDYGIDDSDRLDSEISLSRITDREMRRARLTVYQSLRAAEDNDRLPPVVAEARGERRATPAIGGTLSYGAGLQGHLRTLDAGPDGLGDALRAGVWADWHRARVTGPGLVVETRTGLRLDHYAFSPDALARDTTRATAQAAVTLRYPLIRQGPRAAHVLEPVAQLAWSDTTGGPVPNEDSSTAEFDVASLFALSRFPGEDATETGPRAALGLTWTRRGRDGLNSRLTFGRVLRGAENPAFTRTSGLDGTASDWLVAGALDTGSELGLRGRALIDDDIAVTRAEALLDWRTDRLTLAAGYIFLPEDAEEDRSGAVREITLDSRYRVNERWAAGLDMRYDLADGEPSTAGLELGWRNECITVDFSVSRRFTSSTTVQPTTDFGLVVGLDGFSAGRTGAGAARRCQD
ncbi:LPS-assembly protein LptD [Salibaculum halophilum]|uniref:LPS-assembly protein LptD n=1 Tax=Salibaculum halophilum TaxID=1914408 RepID=UPI000A110DB3|nr:LPS assembly protein LptD [Salibaculum halophilum]